MGIMATPKSPKMTDFGQNPSGNHCKSSRAVFCPLLAILVKTRKSTWPKVISLFGGLLAKIGPMHVKGWSKVGSKVTPFLTKMVQKWGHFLDPLFDPFWPDPQLVTLKMRPFGPEGLQKRAIFTPKMAHFGPFLGHFWTHFWTHLRPICVQNGVKNGVIFGPFLAHFWPKNDPIFDPFLTHFWAILNVKTVVYGVQDGAQNGTHFWAIFGPFLGHF